MAKTILPRNLRIDLTGKKFGRLRVVGFAGLNRFRVAMWRCVCKCGNETTVQSKALRDRVRSCGCRAKEINAARMTTHGMCYSREYKSWQAMKTRCLNKNNHGYQDYGARGIRICRRWLRSFANFAADMGPRPEGHSLERKNVNGNYCPSNCRWVSDLDQAKNTRASRLIRFNGRVKIVADWSKETGVPKNTILARLSAGWSVKRTLTTPPDPKFRPRKYEGR